MKIVENIIKIMDINNGNNGMKEEAITMKSNEQQR